MSRSSSATGSGRTREYFEESCRFAALFLERLPAGRAPPRRRAARQHARLPLRVRRCGADRRRDRRASTTPAATSTCCATSSTRTAASCSPSRATRRCSRRSRTSCRPILSSTRFADADDARRALGASLADALRRARRRVRPRARARHRLDLGADLHVGHVGRAEGRHLLATPAARHRQAHVDDHGPRPRRRRLRVHAAVPLERGAGRVGAVDRHAVRGRPRAAVLRVAAGCADVRHYGATYFNYTGKPLAYLLAQPERADDADNTLRVAFGNEGSPEVVDELRAPVRRRGDRRVRRDRGRRRGQP